MKKTLLFLCLAICTATIFSAFKTSPRENDGGIKLQVIDSASKEGIPFAVVAAIANGVNAGGAITDFEGNAYIKPIKPGTYTVKAQYTGYETKEVKNVVVKDFKATNLTIKLQSTAFR